MSELATRPENPAVGVAVPHESAVLHVTGAALYTDDLIYRTKDVLHAYPVQTSYAHARITSMNTEPALARARRGAGADGRGRAGRQRCRGQARRAAVPVGDHVLRPCRLLGAGRDARGRPARRRGHRGGGRAAHVLYLGHRGDRRPQLPGRAAAGGARRRGHRAGRGRPGVQWRVRVLRPGALLPRDARRARARRRGRTGVRPVEHPASLGDAGDHRPRTRQAQLRDHRAVPADGRRVRRQGDAAPRLRGDRSDRRDPHRPASAPATQPHPGSDDVRQAPRLSRRLARRLRRRRAPARTRGDADRGRRLEPGPVRAGTGAGAVSHRQRLLDPPRPDQRTDRQDA